MGTTNYNKFEDAISSLLQKTRTDPRLSYLDNLVDDEDDHEVEAIYFPYESSRRDFGQWGENSLKFTAP